MTTAHNQGVDHTRMINVPRNEEWDAFDRLPKAIRDALNRSLGKWSALQIMEMMTQPQPFSAGQILQMWDRKEDEIWRRYIIDTQQDVILFRPDTYRDNPRPRSPHRGPRLPRRLGCRWV